jgi:hypothetical protein
MDYIYEPIRNEEGSVIDAKDNALPIKREITASLPDWAIVGTVKGIRSR